MTSISRAPGNGVAEAEAGRKCVYDVLVKQADVKVTGTGKTFLNAVVEDVTGGIECIQWDPGAADIDAWTKHEVVVVQGKVGTYKDKPQITVSTVFPLPRDDIDWKHVLKASPVDYQWMKETRTAFIGSIRAGHREGISEPLADVVDALTSTPEFLNCPAATFMHHAYVHGLLEHSLSVCENAVMYSGLGDRRRNEFGEQRSGGWDMDVVIAGALLHDVGKIYEYTMTGKRTPASKTLGHSLMGCEMFSKAAEYHTMDQAVVDQVKHVIASHHARVEWGAIVEPQTSEAWLIHAMDLADSRMFATSRRVK